MNLKNVKSIFCSILITAIIGSVTTAQAAVKRSISSIVIDADSGKVITSSNADERRYPASLTKLMTLYITFDALEKGKLKFSDNLKVSRHAANRAPSKIGVKAGGTIRVKDAVMALIVKSANDCASVLAEALGGSEENFAKIMTQTAKDLGMKDTTFKNASGLPDPKQRTTARDMAILGSAIYHHFPEYYDLFATRKFQYNGKTYYTHNHLLKNFEGADGMKTGYTNAAGYNIVTSAKRNGQRVIAVTMGHRTIKDRDYKVAQLMNKGLKKLASAEKTSLEASAKLDIPSLVEDTNISEERDWAIQIGAFSNYVKARNYALKIQNTLQLPFMEKTAVNVEAATKGVAIVYRSQLTGFAKNEADKTCYRLNKDNKSCIVVASQEQQQLVMVNK